MSALDDALPALRTQRIVMLGAWALLTAVPMMATGLYSVADRWQNRAFPDGYTWRWWFATLTEPRVVEALLRSVVVAALTVVLVAALTVPPLYWSYVRTPALRPVLQFSALLPFALPFVVLAYGMKSLAGATPLTRPFEASAALLVLGHVALAFPFFLWPLDAAMAGAGVRRLHEAATASGAGASAVLWHVLLPAVRPGMITGSVLCFATSFGEYSIAKVITGSSFETLPVWQVAALADTRGNPNGVAVMAVLTFVVLFAAAVVTATTGRAPVSVVPLPMRDPDHD